uniref:Uncharacterized protein n=1 Tax=Avena sativa TaxID=4498 RepID=A0ACD5TRY7_AVESA
MLGGAAHASQRGSCATPGPSRPAWQACGAVRAGAAQKVAAPRGLKWQKRVIHYGYVQSPRALGTAVLLRLDFDSVTAEQCRSDFLGVRSSVRVGTWPAPAASTGAASSARTAAPHSKCPHDGCERYVTYHEVLEHQSACPHAPCHCTEPGCGFAGPTPALVAHLDAAHAMPVHKVPYGKTTRIQVPVPGLPRCVLVGAGDEGDAAFLLTLGALGAATVVSAVCIRAAAACPWPRYTIKMWSNGPPLTAPATNRVMDIVLAEFDATSSTTPGAVAFDDQLTSYLTVPPGYLVGDGPSKELSLHIRIEKITS